MKRSDEKQLFFMTNNLLHIFLCSTSLDDTAGIRAIEECKLCRIFLLNAVYSDHL